MKKKRIAFEEERAKEILNQSLIRVKRESSDYFFEIEKETTSDIAEGVSILMRKLDWSDPIWNTEIGKIVYEDITPEKALFWLTGGSVEWRTLKHYNRPWCDSYLEFQEEYGFIIINIIKKSKKLSDIRDGFLKYLNLPILYNFAISRGLVK